MDRAELGDWVRSGLGESSGHGNSEQKQRRAKWMASSRAQEAGNNRATNRGARGARDPEIQSAGRAQGDMQAQENSRRGDQGARPGEQQGARRARDGRARRATLGSSAQRAEQEDEKRLRAGLNPSWSTATSAGARQTEPNGAEFRRAGNRHGRAQRWPSAIGAATGRSWGQAMTRATGRLKPWEETRLGAWRAESEQSTGHGN
jgi:hypothetical protein|uniref:Uncharacterized protein n=1 Tax=Zea mays TaxID=4577 RepID=C0PNQ3_MAIZE|nr:unknown [Zea mays]